MKIQDLQKYKTLDITQLSGSPWNTAEKVLGLDSGDTVVMANRMDDEAKQYTDDAIASALTSYYTKDEVDEIVEDIDVTEQLTNYYTKGEVDTANAAQDERIENNENDIADLQSEMVNKSELETAMADETARTESTYAKPSDIPDLTPYATKGWVESKSYVNGAFVDTKVNEAITSETARTESVYAKKTDIPDMGEYATKDYVEGAMEVETARTESTYLKEHQSLENYYTKSQVDTLIDDIDVSDQLANYALSSSVTEDINTAIANETARTESTYLKEHQSLDNYYTKAQVDSAITRVEEEIPLVPVNVSAFVNDAGYLTEHQSLAGLFNSASYDSETKRINFYDKSNVLSSYIDATAFIKDGMVERVYITGSTLVVSFNTDAGTEDIELDLTDVFDPANYYTKGQVDALMASETARTENTYLKEHQSLANYYNKGEVDGMFNSAATMTANAIDAAETRANAYAESVVEGYATEQYVDDAIAGIAIPTDYATQEDIDAAVQGLASEQYVDDAIAAIPAPDLSEYATHSEVDNAVGDVVMGLGMIGLVNDVSASGGTVTVRKTGMENGQIVTGSTSFNIVRPEDLSAAMDAASAWTDATYAKKSEIPSLENYATEAYVDNAIATETARTESTYLKEHQSLDDYYTKATIDSRLQDKADRMDVMTEIEDAISEETARTENIYAKKSEIPSLNGYATEAWVEGKGYITGVTVDDELDITSTNPVQNNVLTGVLNGVSSSTQMEVSSTDSTTKLRYRFYGNPNSSYMFANFKETNIDGYYVLDLGDLPVGTAQNINMLLIDRIDINSTSYYYRLYNPETSNLGEKVNLEANGGYSINMYPSNLGDTYDYYFVLNANENYVFLSATLPVITEVSDHKANISDIPTAQDGSGFGQFVYDGGIKRVIREVYGNPKQLIQSNGTKYPYINIGSYYWSGDSTTNRVALPVGNEYVGGVKTERDSKVISKAEEALNGFEEQITLTIGSASTDTINFNWSDVSLFETDDERYLVLPDSATTDAYKYITQIVLSGTSYYIQNPMFDVWDTNNPVLGKYQLGTMRPYQYQFTLYDANNNLYIIIDKELLTIEISDTLTITRGKQLNGAFIEPKDLTGGTETIIQTLEVGGDSTGTTLTIHLDNGKVVNDYTYPLKETNAGYLLVYDVSNYHSTYYSVLSVSDNNTVYYPVTDGDEVIGEPNLVFDLSTTQTGKLEFPYEAYNWLIYNTIDHTLTFASSLPTWSETVPTAGILDDYYTKTEIDGMIGDIESLLANI